MYFERNKDIIYLIKKCMNINNNVYINKLVEEIDMVNEKNLQQGAIDVLEISDYISSQRQLKSLIPHMSKEKMSTRKEQIKIIY